MIRTNTHLWCRFVKHRNPLSQVQCSADALAYYRYPNYMRTSGVRTKAKTPVKISENTIPPASSLIKPTIVTVLFSSASFAGAAIWQYENMRNRAREVFRSPKKWMVDRIEPAELWFRSKIHMKQGSLRQASNTWYNNLTEGQKIFLPILFVNSLVFLGWRIPRLNGFMSRYFLSHSTSYAKCLPMFLSCFSHNSILHLGLNMYVLHSFISNIVDTLGKEQFLALYLSSGMVAALASQVFRTLMKQQVSSLGASGCIMGIISYTCFKYPDTQLSIVLFPWFVFSALSGIRTLMMVDFVCLFTKFGFFDHAAHLGGALTGLFWYAYGNEYIWQKRGPVLEWWHRIRNQTP